MTTRCLQPYQTFRQSAQLLAVTFALSLAIRIGRYHLLVCLLIRVDLPAPSASSSPTAHQMRGSRIAEPEHGLSTMPRTEFVMTMIAQHTDAIENDQAATVRATLLTARFLCHYDSEGRLQLAELKTNALYLEATEIPAAITAGALPRELLLAILSAAASRLGVPLPGETDE